MRGWGGTLSAVKRLINPPGIVLRVIDDGIIRVGITQLVDQGGIAGADGEPVEVGVITDLLALVEVPDQPRTKNVAAEVDSNLLVQVDVVAVLLHTLDAGFIARLAGVSLGGMGAIGRPSIHWQRDRFSDRLEQQAFRYGHICGTTGASSEEAERS